MLMRSTLPSIDDYGGPSSALVRVLVRLYVLPVLAGWVLALNMVIWLIVIFDASTWTAVAVASLLAAVGTILVEEVVYDGE